MRDVRRTPFSEMHPRGAVDSLERIETACSQSSDAGAAGVFAGGPNPTIGETPTQYDDVLAHLLTRDGAGKKERKRRKRFLPIYARQVAHFMQWADDVRALQVADVLDRTGRMNYVAEARWRFSLRKRVVRSAWLTVLRWKLATQQQLTDEENDALPSLEAEREEYQRRRAEREEEQATIASSARGAEKNVFSMQVGSGEDLTNAVVVLGRLDRGFELRSVLPLYGADRSDRQVEFATTLDAKAIRATLGGLDDERIMVRTVRNVPLERNPLLRAI